ncbi:AraC family transcriptional regulator [Paenibacillaceae bacterium]|nr:AraC family transcriptional regulator [Paenibacillaceae bacterium]
MKLINDLNLMKEPIQIKFAHTILNGFPGYYHSHQGMEFLYVHEGEGDILINRKIYEVRPNTLLYFQPYQLHRVRMNVSPSRPYTRTKLTFEPSVIDSKMSFAPGLQSFFRQMWKQEITEPVLYIDDPQPRLESIINENIKHYHTMEYSQQQEAAVLFLVEFFHILQTNFRTALFGQSASPSKRGLHLTEIVLEWLEDHLHEPFELDRLAAVLHVSKHHLSRLFKQSTGNTITEYLTIIRIQKACHLLESTENTVEHIAQELGITNTSYFCEIFRKSIGTTPLQYRLALLERA